MRVPRVPGAIGEYPTPNPVANSKKKRLKISPTWHSTEGIEHSVKSFLCALRLALGSDRNPSLFKIRLYLRNSIFPIMKDRSRKHGVRLSMNEPLI